MLTSKDFKNIVTKSKVSVDIDMTKELEGLTSSQQTRLKNIVGTSFINEIEESTRKKTSTVNQTGSNAFKKLSKEYRKLKLASGKGGQPNLRLTDQMINDIFSKNKANGVSLRITNNLSKKKAENHNHGVTLPKRQFLPTRNGQGFRREIMNIINRQIKAFKKSVGALDKAEE